jgi:hypothetical protein
LATEAYWESEEESVSQPFNISPSSPEEASPVSYGLTVTVDGCCSGCSRAPDGGPGWGVIFGAEWAGRRCRVVRGRVHSRLSGAVVWLWLELLSLDRIILSTKL